MLPVLERETGRVQVKAPAGQDVTVDGASRGNAPIKDAVDLLPGAHRVACGGKVVEVTLRAGETLTVDVTCAPRAWGADERRGPIGASATIRALLEPRG